MAPMNGILKVILLLCIANAGLNKKVSTVFQFALSRSNFSAPAKNKDGQPKTLNPHREIQVEIIVCKTLLHSVSPEPLTME